MGLLALKAAVGGSLGTAGFSGWEAHTLAAKNKEVEEALIVGHGLLILAAGSLAIYAGILHAYYPREESEEPIQPVLAEM